MKVELVSEKDQIVPQIALQVFKKEDKTKSSIIDMKNIQKYLSVKKISKSFSSVKCSMNDGVV